MPEHGTPAIVPQPWPVPRTPQPKLPAGAPVPPPSNRPPVMSMSSKPEARLPPSATLTGPANTSDDRMPASRAALIAASRDIRGVRPRSWTCILAEVGLMTSWPSVPVSSAIAVGALAVPSVPPSSASPSSGGGGVKSSVDTSTERSVASSRSAMSVGAPVIDSDAVDIRPHSATWATADAARNASGPRSHATPAGADAAGASMPRTQNDAWPTWVLSAVPTYSGSATWPAARIDASVVLVPANATSPSRPASGATKPPAPCSTSVCSGGASASGMSTPSFWPTRRRVRAAACLRSRLVAMQPRPVITPASASTSTAALWRVGRNAHAGRFSAIHCSRAAASCAAARSP
jgi:hypothetical protein